MVGDQDVDATLPRTILLWYGVTQGLGQCIAVTPAVVLTVDAADSLSKSVVRMTSYMAKTCRERSLSVDASDQPPLHMDRELPLRFLIA